jgi:hypothetical protein
MDPIMSAEQEVMSGGARGRKPLGCTLKKAECAKKSDCVWVQGKGCRHEDSLPLGLLAKMAKRAKSPSPVKAKTPSPVKALTPSPVKALTPSPVNAAKKGRKPTGCNLKKPECAKKSDCVWIVGKGCRHESKVPRAKTPTPPKAKTPSPPKPVAKKDSEAKPKLKVTRRSRFKK